MKKIVPTTPVALSTRTMKQVTPKPFMLILLVVPTVLVTTDLKGLVSPVKILTNVIIVPLYLVTIVTLPMVNVSIPTDHLNVDVMKVTKFNFSISR